jgi:hypothetical protein
MEHPHNIFFDHILANLEEYHSKTNKAWCLITVYTFHHLKNLTIFKQLLQPRGFLLLNGIKSKAIQLEPPAKLLGKQSLIELHKVFPNLSLIG